MKRYLSFIVIIAVSAIAEFGLIYFLVRPEVSKYINGKSSISVEDEKIVSLQEEQQKLNDFINSADLIKETGVIANSLLPADNLANNFMLELDSLAKSSNLTIPTITIDEVKSAPVATTKTEEGTTDTGTAKTEPAKSGYPAGINVLNFQSTVSGTYDDFLAFLTKLESDKRFNLLPALSLSPSADIVSVALSGSIFYYPKPANSNANPVNFDQTNIAKIKGLVVNKPFQKPSSIGSDGRDNPFAAIE